MNDDVQIDAILVERSQKGDLDAINSLFRRHHASAMLYALQLTKNRDDASDIVSDGFLRISRAIERFRSNSSFTSWMCTILRNCFLDTLKKRRVKVISSLDEKVETDSGTLVIDSVDHSESAFDLAAKEEYSRTVRLAIGQLPMCQRQLLFMRHHLSLSYTEIAAQVSAPTGTIKSRLYRANLNLAKIIRGAPDLRRLEDPDARLA